MISRKTKTSYIILVIAMSAFIVGLTMLLAFSGAWFTATTNKNSVITTGVVAVNVKQNNTIVNAETALQLNQTSTVNASLISAGLSNQIKVNNTSESIDVYVRAYITCNYTSEDSNLGSAFDVLTFTLGSNWGAINGSTDNQKIKNGYVYYKSKLNSNSTVELINSITASAAMPSSATLNVFIEAVQADEIGKARFIESDSALTNQNWSTLFA